MKKCGKNTTFERLQEANRKTFLNDARYAGKKAVLLQVITALNSAGVTWALSCSAGLYFKGLVPEFGDFDIIVSPTEYEKLKVVLTAIGAKLKPTVQKDHFLTVMYQQAEMEGVEFDLFGQFWIQTFESEVKYELKKEDIQQVSLTEEVSVPVLCVEVQYVLYSMMVGWQATRRWKAEICWSYLCESGVSNRAALLAVYQQTPALPEFLREGIRKLLDKK